MRKGVQPTSCQPSGPNIILMKEANMTDTLLGGKRHGQQGRDPTLPQLLSRGWRSRCASLNMRSIGPLAKWPGLNTSHWGDKGRLCPILQVWTSCQLWTWSTDQQNNELATKLFQAELAERSRVKWDTSNLTVSPVHLRLRCMGSIFIRLGRKGVNFGNSVVGPGFFFYLKTNDEDVVK